MNHNKLHRVQTSYDLDREGEFNFNPQQKEQEEIQASYTTNLVYSRRKLVSLAE